VRFLLRVFPVDSALSQLILSAVLVASPNLQRMDSTSTPDRRSAHRRVGAATVLAFLALLLLGAVRGPAEADSSVPVAVPAATPTVEPRQPLPAQPTDPDPGPGFGREHDGPGPRGGDDGGFGGGGGAAPAPSTGGSQT
jgi:hypothetical protein